MLSVGAGKRSPAETAKQRVEPGGNVFLTERERLWQVQEMMNDPTLAPISEDSDQPATKADVQAAVSHLENRIDAKFDAIKREILDHFDAAVENIEDDLKGVNQAEIDLTGAILTRAADNKGKRDDRDYLPDVTLSHLADIAGFEPLTFPWYENREWLWTECQRIQRAAGIHLPCPDADKHECTPACHVYGFHALRRAYATLNADRMPAAVLQKKMRHRSFTTTQRYIELADKMKKTSEQVSVPDFLEERKAN